MAESGFRQWIQDPIVIPGQREAMSSNTHRSSGGSSQLKPASSRKIAWNNDNSEYDDSATYAFSTANAASSSETIKALTDDQKEIFSYTKEDRREQVGGNNTITETQSQIRPEQHRKKHNQINMSKWG